jgi:SAM-dependent methyltransferase
MKPTRITEADLAWWLELAAALPWTFAKTYAETAPHSYIVLGRTPLLTKADFVRAGAVIRTFGEPGKFYNMTNIYLTSPDGVLKWWAMDAAVADTGLINQATTDRVYGEQNAPDTRSTVHSVYDEIATQYDDLYSPVDGDERTGLLRLLEGRFDSAPTTLDIGCGTGAVLDLGITTPDRYTGLDPSQAMLNELIMKQRGGIAGVIPKRLEDADPELRGQQFELVIAAFGSASYFDPAMMRMLNQICSDTILLMTFRDGYRPAFDDSSIRFTFAEALRLAAAPGDDARVTSIGKFDVVTIRKRN